MPTCVTTMPARDHEVHEEDGEQQVRAGQWHRQAAEVLDEEQRVEVALLDVVEVVRLLRERAQVREQQEKKQDHDREQVRREQGKQPASDARGPRHQAGPGLRGRRRGERAGRGRLGGRRGAGHGFASSERAKARTSSNTAARSGVRPTALMITISSPRGSQMAAREAPSTLRPSRVVSVPS